MKVQPIRDPLEGEHVLAVDPEMAPNPAPDWRRRLNLWTGRTLTDAALVVEQRGRSGSLALAARGVSAGVVRGLAADAEEDATGEAPAIFVHVSPGRGLTSTGEDVSVPRPLRVPLDEIPTWAPVSEGSADAESDGSEALLARAEGPSLRELREAGDPLPRAAVLVVRPVTVSIVGEAEGDDPCERDTSADAFEDWQLVDGARLLLYVWPDEWEPLPPDGPRWRNRLAYTVFRREEALPVGERLPWEGVGVPLALLGFDPSGDLLFLDGAAVTRDGGRPRVPSLPGLPRRGALLWRARVRQLVEHLAEQEEEGVEPGSLERELRFVPPVGLLPPELLDPTAREQSFFPPSYDVEALPVPEEQVGLAVEQSAAMEPFDLSSPDRVRILVPVPQGVYEPRLLRTEQVDPAFNEAIQEYVGRRAEWLLRRRTVRSSVAALTRAVRGEAIQYPDPDPDALESETVAEGPLDPPEEPFGTEPAVDEEGGAVVDDDGVPLRRAVAFQELLDSLDERTPLEESELAELEARGIQDFVEALEQRIKAADDVIDFGFLRVQADMYRLRGLMLDETQANRLATSPALASIVKGESALATRENLVQYLNLARERSARPDEGESGEGEGTDGDGGGGGGGFVGAGPFITNVSFFGGSTEEEVSGEEGFLSAELLGIRSDVDRAAMEGLIETGGIITSGGLTPERELSETQVVQLGSVEASGQLFVRPALQEEVLFSSPIVGKALDFRNVTIAERLEPPRAPQAKHFAVATKHELVTRVAALELSTDDLVVRGIPRFDDSDEPLFDEGGLPLRTSEQLGDLDPSLVLAEPEPTATDEASFFAVGVALLEDAIALLRQGEGRIQGYRVAVRLCRKTVEKLGEHVRDADRRLKVIGDEVAEARHDVSVARALLAEEESRVEGINERRAEVLAEHVRVLVYHRPRVAYARTDPPHHVLEPGLSEAPVPACLHRQVPAPAELRTMVDLLREAPVSWFPGEWRLLDGLDRLDVLRGTVVHARARARTPRTVDRSRTSDGTLARAIGRTVAAQRERTADRRRKLASLDLSSLSGLSWRRSRDRAAGLLSLGDLLDAGHGRMDVDRRAARALDEILGVSACLYARFGEVAPALRLGWAERLSQHDESVGLRSLYALPRWGAVNPLARREMQALVDWLYGRVDPRVSPAVAFIDDLVRVAILLASHAPVSGIVSGRVAEPTVAGPGELVRVDVDLSRVRVGMGVVLYAAGGSLARGVVEDLSAGQASARVLEAPGGSVTLDRGGKVHFSESRAVVGMAGAGARRR